MRLRHCDVRAPRRVALVTLSLLHLSVSRQSVWVIRGWGGGAEGWWGIKSSGTHGTHTQHPYAASLTSAPAMLDGIVTNNKQITDNQSTLSEVCVFVGLVFRSWWCFCVCVCVWMPTLQGHMEGTGWVVPVQGAKKETINHHCDVQTRPWSHGWVRGVMEVMRIRCGSIISFINKMAGTVDVYIVDSQGANVQCTC